MSSDTAFLKKVIFYVMTTAACLSFAAPSQVIAEANKKAALEPSKQNFFNASMIFDWEQSRLLQVHTKPERIIDIAFEVGEAILSIGGGDSQRWTISETQTRPKVAKIRI